MCSVFGSVGIRCHYSERSGARVSARHYADVVMVMMMSPKWGARARVEPVLLILQRGRNIVIMLIPRPRSLHELIARINTGTHEQKRTSFWRVITKQRQRSTTKLELVFALLHLKAYLVADTKKNRVRFGSYTETKKYRPAGLHCNTTQMYTIRLKLSIFFSLSLRPSRSQISILLAAAAESAAFTVIHPCAQIGRRLNAFACRVMPRILHKPRASACVRACERALACVQRGRCARLGSAAPCRLTRPPLACTLERVL